ncbi:MULTISPECIES: SDR family NAD(P)-dependent oxidoreductase [unclassified Nocardioides]|uniref:SDR family NAD(P)-dependent oxidoreductase n=1 Tax=unclassified Nocardioides TaxID=2615069 RepID=UPI0006F4AF0E|nr:MULTISPECIES: SDR family oxidoreductase [unclassified Nocardioides]KQY50869.1 oxidoreductase [Nocardioides sp. Root140]KRF14709.1 oxidoreductase [Nocardioides sp. Soil796]
MNARPLVRTHSEQAVLVAGGTSGVGLASAEAFLDAGVRRIALMGRSQERGTRARATLLERCPDAQVEFLSVDAGDVDLVQEAVAEVHRRLGGLDVLVSSVTTAYRPELLHRTDPLDIAGILSGQAVPPMLLTRAVLPFMREQGGGSIINIASDAAKVATPGESVLGAAMAAIVMFSRVAAIEAKRDGVRVNVLTPSLIAGTATAKNVLSDGFSKKLFEKAAEQAHLGVAEPEDLAAMVVFLAGPGAARVTGQAISVNGGISAA